MVGTAVTDIIRDGVEVHILLMKQKSICSATSLCSSMIMAGMSTLGIGLYIPGLSKTIFPLIGGNAGP